MSEVLKIRRFEKPLDIRLADEPIVLPGYLEERIQAYWRSLLTDNPALSNGEVFTITSIDEDAEAIRIRLAETDYAHFLYSRRTRMVGEFAVRVIHPSALVLSSDSKLIFGSMNTHTSRPGIIQCCGGGLDNAALESNGVVNIDKTMMNELAEELGVIAGDSRVDSLIPSYLKYGEPPGHITLAYVVRLLVTSEQFMKDYVEFVESLQQRGEMPEFSEMFSIDNDAAIVDAFIERYQDRLNEYMTLLLRVVSSESKELSQSYSSTGND